MLPGAKKEVESLNELLEQAKAIRARVIRVAPAEEPLAIATGDAVSGESAYYRLGVRYEAVGRLCRRVVFFETGMQRVLSERAREQSSLFRVDQIICFVTAVERIDTLSANHPTFLFRLWEAEGPVDEDVRKEVLAEAADSRLRPFPMASS